MIRHICALAATVALSLSAVACTEPTESEATGAEETSQDLVSRSAYFETFQGLDGQHYFNLTAANGEEVLRSEGYVASASVDTGITSVLENGEDKRNFEVIEASNGDYYFNLKAQNGEVIGTSQLYASKSNAERGARTVRALVRLANQELREQAAPRRERFELFKGEDGQSYFHLRAGNGEILLGSQAYTATSSAKKGVASVQNNGKSAARFDVFEAVNGKWGVRLVAANGEIVARGQMYASKSNATRAVNKLVEILSAGVQISE
jgi:uncharacterized protein YegP (UPF0339 family)